MSKDKIILFERKYKLEISETELINICHALEDTLVKEGKLNNLTKKHIKEFIARAKEALE